MAPGHPGTFPRAPSPPGGLSVKTSSWRRAARPPTWRPRPGELCSMQAGVAAHLGPCRSLGHLPAQPFGLQQLRAGPSSLGHRCCPTQSRNKAGHRALGSGRPRQPGALRALPTAWPQPCSRPRPVLAGGLLGGGGPFLHILLNFLWECTEVLLDARQAKPLGVEQTAFLAHTHQPAA